jgi:hypothetical protein
MAQSKSNIGPLGRTQVFSKAEGQFRWHGVSRLSAEMLAGAGRGPDPYAFLEAVCWLEDRLHEGLPVPSMELCREAEEEGLSFSTLRRAKKALGVRSLKRDDQWEWQLPARPVIRPPEPLRSLASLASLEPLQAQQEVTQESSHTDAVQAPETPPLPPEALGRENDPVQAVETTEGAQAVQDVQASHAPTNGQRRPPRFCPRCHRQVTWRIRDGHVVCHNCSAQVRSS